MELEFESPLEVEVTVLISGVFSCGAEAWPVVLNGFIATVMMPPTEPMTRRVSIDINESFCIFYARLRCCDVRYILECQAKFVANL